MYIPAQCNCLCIPRTGEDNPPAGVGYQETGGNIGTVEQSGAEQNQSMDYGDIIVDSASSIN